MKNNYLVICVLCLLTSAVSYSAETQWQKISCDGVSTTLANNDDNYVEPKRQVLIIERAGQLITVSTLETRYLLLNHPCQAISDDKPLMYCPSQDGTEVTFYSFQRIEAGYTEPYQNDITNSNVYVFNLERSTTSANGQYLRVKRQMVFKSTDCVVE